MFSGCILEKGKLREYVLEDFPALLPLLAGKSQRVFSLMSATYGGLQGGDYYVADSLLKFLGGAYSPFVSLCSDEGAQDMLRTMVQKGASLDERGIVFFSNHL